MKFIPKQIKKAVAFKVNEEALSELKLLISGEPSFDLCSSPYPLAEKFAEQELKPLAASQVQGYGLEHICVLQGRYILFTLKVETKILANGTKERMLQKRIQEYLDKGLPVTKEVEAELAAECVAEMLKVAFYCTKRVPFYIDLNNGLLVVCDTSLRCRDMAKEILGSTLEDFKATPYLNKTKLEASGAEILTNWLSEGRISCGAHPFEFMDDWQLEASGSQIKAEGIDVSETVEEYLLQGFKVKKLGIHIVGVSYFNFYKDFTIRNFKIEDMDVTLSEIGGEEEAEKEDDQEVALSERVASFLLAADTLEKTLSLLKKQILITDEVLSKGVANF